MYCVECKKNFEDENLYLVHLNTTSCGDNQLRKSICVGCKKELEFTRKDIDTYIFNGITTCLECKEKVHKEQKEIIDKFIIDYKDNISFAINTKEELVDILILSRVSEKYTYHDCKEILTPLIPNLVPDNLADRYKETAWKVLHKEYLKKGGLYPLLYFRSCISMVDSRSCTAKASD